MREVIPIESLAFDNKLPVPVTGLVTQELFCEHVDLLPGKGQLKDTLDSTWKFCLESQGRHYKLGFLNSLLFIMVVCLLC